MISAVSHRKHWFSQDSNLSDRLLQLPLSHSHMYDAVRHMQSTTTILASVAFDFRSSQQAGQSCPLERT